MPGVQDDEMVQALSSDGADQAFYVRILPGTLWGGKDLFHSERRDPQTNVVAIDAVAVSYKIAGCILIDEGLHDLLRRPGGGRMLGNVEVQHLATAMLEHDEHEQHLHGD